jgi:hypothetical protein
MSASLGVGSAMQVSLFSGGGESPGWNLLSFGGVEGLGIGNGMSSFSVGEDELFLLGSGDLNSGRNGVAISLCHSGVANNGVLWTWACCCCTHMSCFQGFLCLGSLGHNGAGEDADS